MRGEIADLAMHFSNRSLVDLDVVSYVGVAMGGFSVAVFHVGHVDVDHTVEEGQGFEAIVPPVL